MQRDRIFRRKQRRAHIKRKKRILKETNMFLPKCLGALSKGKIHCSCPMCSAKYSREPSISDKKKLSNIKDQLDNT